MLFVFVAAEPRLLLCEQSGAQAASALRGCRGQRLHDCHRCVFIQRESRCRVRIGIALLDLI